LSASLNQLMNPQSIAIVGASQRADAAGTCVIRNLRRLGYPGRVYPINPNYDEVEGLRCYRSLSALPEPVEAVFLAVPAASGPALVEEAASCKIPAVFINANGYADGDAQGIALQGQIEALVRAHAMALCGPNNLGIINVHDKAAIWTQRSMPAIKPGPLALISQSGSVAIALAEDERQIGFAYVITAGNEADLSVAEYLDHLACDLRVEIILLYLETVRNLQGFAAAAREASRRGKRVVALKLGRSEEGRALVQAHTGSLAGEDRLYDAYFRDLGIVRVRDLDELIETAILFCAPTKARSTTRIGAVTLSGGEAALIADLGHDLGLSFPALAPSTIERLRPTFPSYATLRNPLDVWGSGFSQERFGAILDGLTTATEIDTIVVAVDAPASGGADARLAGIMAEACVARAATLEKQFVFVNNTCGTGPNPAIRHILSRAQIPYLSGLRMGLTALRNVIRAPHSRPQSQLTTPATSTWVNQLLKGNDVERFRLLSERGLPMVECAAVDSAAAAVRIADAWGYPVVLKGSADALPHKSDLGLVRFPLNNDGDIEAAYDEVFAILAHHDGSGRQIYLQRIANPGVELLVGCRNEPHFGSFILVGLGGTLAEVMDKVSLRVGPIDETQAEEMLEETSAARLLRGLRGKGPFDFGAAVKAIVKASEIGAACIGTVASLEMNPLIVHERGAAAVDILVEPV
jgi:acyl-CoA synthetase (NDP forming)